MKRIGYIYPKICDKENIKNAILKASKNKRNRKSVKRCLDNIDLCVDKIFDLLSNKSYSPTPTRKKTILRKSIMYRMSRKVKRTYKRETWNFHNCCSILSYLGWVKHTDSYGFYHCRIKPYINVKKMKGVVKNYNHNKRQKTV